MYYIYDRVPIGDGFQFTRREETHLFGCNNGWIPYFVKCALIENDSEPFPWRADVSNILVKEEGQTATLVIDLKPYSATPNVSLYEIAEVWGYSSHEWTPIMLHLRGLYVDQDPTTIDPKSFTRTAEQIQEPIFSFMYLRGSVAGRKIVGPWTPPGKSPTNSVLLWPDAFRYFSSNANNILSQFGLPGLYVNN